MKVGNYSQNTEQYRKLKIRTDNEKNAKLAVSLLKADGFIHSSKQEN